MAIRFRLALVAFVLLSVLGALPGRGEAGHFGPPPSGLLRSSDQDGVHLAKTIRRTFNSAAKPVVRPPATRSMAPKPKPPRARLAPGPRPPGLGTSSIRAQPGAGPVRGARASGRNPKGKAATIAAAGNRAPAVARPSAAFRAEARRGALRPGFNRAARPAARAVPARGATTLWGTPPNLRRNTLRPIFNGSVRNSKIAADFRKANSYPGAMGPVTWRLTKPGEVFTRSHYGSSSRQSGRYAALSRSPNVRHARETYALPKANKGYRVSQFVGTGRELVGISRVAPAYGRRGGGLQAYFPSMPSFKPAGWNKGALQEIFGQAAAK